jgi:hypothetical protein
LLDCFSAAQQIRLRQPAFAAMESVDDRAFDPYFVVVGLLTQRPRERVRA